MRGAAAAEEFCRATSRAGRSLAVPPGAPASLPARCGFGGVPAERTSPRTRRQGCRRSRWYRQDAPVTPVPLFLAGVGTVAGYNRNRLEESHRIRGKRSEEHTSELQSPYGISYA